MNKIRIIGLRHGNTFEPDETPVYVGKYQDLPLTHKGREQIQEAAHRIRPFTQDKDLPSGIQIYYGPLLRHSQSLDEIRKTIPELLAPTSETDTQYRKLPWLNELSYGNWANLSTDEVRAQFDPASISAWESHALIPSDALWEEDDTSWIHTLTQGLIELISTASTKHSTTILLISSGGTLRGVARALSVISPKKLAPGRFFVIDLKATELPSDQMTLSAVESTVCHWE